MAHFILEYSTNISDTQLKLAVLFEQLHNAAVETGIFPLAGIRSRAIACQDFRVADGNPEFAFVHLQVKIGAGRSNDEQTRAAKTFFDILSAHLSELSESRGLAISFELTN